MLFTKEQALQFLGAVPGIRDPSGAANRLDEMFVDGKVFGNDADARQIFFDADARQLELYLWDRERRRACPEVM